GRFLRTFTFLELDEIAEVEARQAADPGRREGQRLLAGEVTALVHGPAAAAEAEAAAGILFGGSPQEASAGTLATLAGEVPTATVPRARLREGVDVAELLFETGVSASKGEARRTVGQGAAYVNNERALDDRLVTDADL